MLVSKDAKVCVTPMRTLKFALPSTRNPNASQWNISCVGSPGVGARVGHVHFMLFVSISFALGSQCKPSFQWNMSHTLSRGLCVKTFGLAIFPFCSPLTVVKDWSLKRHTCCILRTWPSCLTSSCCFWPVHITNCLRRAGWYSCRFGKHKISSSFHFKVLASTI